LNKNFQRRRIAQAKNTWQMVLNTHNSRAVLQGVERRLATTIVGAC
jgi:hypothetical protein